jgi:hypothetical protein
LFKRSRCPSIQPGDSFSCQFDIGVSRIKTRVCFQKHKPRKKMRKYAVSQIKPKGKQGGNVEYNP